LPLNPLHAEHSRSFETFRFVYPVLSRRAGGISLGVNLNPDKVCNFDCIYCQVDRTSHSETQFVDLEALAAELELGLELVVSGRLYESPKFAATPAELRRLSDLALSGDGEPTSYRNFEQIVALCAEVKRRHAGAGLPIVLITNASLFHRPHVARGLALLDANQGEIWAKLEAGTEEYFRLVERTTVPFRQVLDNITQAAQVRPLVIQSLFMRIHGAAPSEAELEAFCARLGEIVAAGGRIKLVQVYTVARRPAESFVTPLADAEVDAVVALVRQRTGLAAQAFYGG
jgi:wyosine [tRNA(Phe)-imidazoG37] synthetase (radical SAM superfamily)